MTPLIFGVGVNKSGTTSLAAALRLLGLRVLHDYRVAERMVEDMLAGALPAELHHFDAFFDGPFWRVLPVLDAFAGERGRYLLTTREVESWITSRLLHVACNRLADDPDLEWLEISTAADRAEHAQVHATVQEYFADRPERLLEIDVTAGDGWGQLCPFVGVNAPYSAFPRENRGEERLRQVLQRLDQRRTED